MQWLLFFLFLSAEYSESKAIKIHKNNLKIQKNVERQAKVQGGSFHLKCPRTWEFHPQTQTNLIWCRCDHGYSGSESHGRLIWCRLASHNTLHTQFHLYTKPCLEIPNRSWSTFVVRFKSLSIRSNCLFVLLVSKAGGGLFQGLGCDKWADKGLLLPAATEAPVEELFTAEKKKKRHCECKKTLAFIIHNLYFAFLSNRIQFS